MAADATELRRLTQEFKDSPGFKLHSDINGSRRGVRIISRNRDESVQSIEALKKQALPGASMNPSESPSLAIALEEVARRLESFLSSASDSLEHTRRHSRKLYGQTEFGKEVQSELDKRFTYESDFKLAQGLRAISVHVDALVPSSGLARGKEGGEEAGCLLQVKQLLMWDEWNDNQRQMLESMKEDVDVQRFVERYFRKIDEFYGWLWKRQGEVHSRELEEAERLRLRAKEAYDKLFPPET